ncbi:MAG: hypothetical protein INR73_05150 [Williamsia sp.]|nr:hypothetical protein [Williamsia sp.]
MKGYKRFLLLFAALVVVYIVAEWNRPKPLDWTVTLSRHDKNPYGAYCLYNELKDVFPRSAINTYQSAVYEQVNNTAQSNTSYLLLAPSLRNLSKEDVNELLNYIALGNYVFFSSFNFGSVLEDTLHFSTSYRDEFRSKDSVTINFKDPSLHTRINTGFKRQTLGRYFKTYDTLKTKILGHNQLNDVNFIQMRIGKGALFIHLLPYCFTNNFLLTRDNATYTAKALSHIPAGVSTVYWDEHYKPNSAGSTNLLRYILNNTSLRWAFRLGLFTMVLYVLFGMKRRQRIIPVIPPVQNSTLDFVRTVGNVYFNRQDNKNIAGKMITYFFEWIRTHFYLQTTEPDEAFAESLSKKSGVHKQAVDELMQLMDAVRGMSHVPDKTLLLLNKRLESFYDQAGK